MKNVTDTAQPRCLST